jgi:hypothetical protein
MRNTGPDNNAIAELRWIVIPGHVPARSSWMIEALERVIRYRRISNEETFFRHRRLPMHRYRPWIL